MAVETRAEDEGEDTVKGGEKVTETTGEMVDVTDVIELGLAENASRGRLHKCIIHFSIMQTYYSYVHT